MRSLSISYKKTDVKYSETINKEYKRLDENLKVPSAGRFIQLKHWDELEGGGDNKNEFPEMFIPGRGLLSRDPDGRFYDYVEMPEKWQWFLWDFWNWASQYKLPKGKIESFYKKPNNERTFAKTTPGSLTYVYVDMVEAHRAFTEAGSPEGGFRDFVTGRNLEAKKNIQWLFNPTCGALLKVIGSNAKYFEVEALDVLKPPPPLSYVIERPWLYFWCTQWGKYSGSTRFPQIKNANSVWGLPASGIPSPLMSKGGKLGILKTSCREVQNGKPWTPYKPVTTVK